MKTIIRLCSIILITVLSACAPGIRFQPGEIPTPTTSDAEAAQEIEQLRNQFIAEGGVWHDPAATRRVSKLFGRLLTATPNTGHWKVMLINDPLFNAMTAPGNNVFVFRGLLDGLPNDDEVAAVLAHEIAHRLARHEEDTAEETFGKVMAGLATIAAGVAVASSPQSTPDQVQSTMESVHTIGSGLTSLRYSKDKEREADQIGLFLLADAGFNPAAAATVWARRSAAEGTGGSDFFSTHPLNEDRYQMAVNLMPLAQQRYQESRRRPRRALSETEQKTVDPATSFELTRAHEALAGNDLQTASSIAHSLTSREPKLADGYNLLGLVKVRSGHTNEAHKAFARGLKLEPENPILMYNMGCAEALRGEREQALAHIERAFTRNPQLVETARTDTDLDSLRADPRFTALLERQYVAPRPLAVGGNTFSMN